ncbi:MAG: type II toxin-antitoxin system mRNA interferase toxin, RelE/StbE family [Candidatus Magasanikbacteria bacterium CG_4_9_14_0_2_um_filter_42_11]|uniref:Type II toxin-antitoxin system mRNA interferase toxin, RelE/StbE family n=1 Tax=Candidatus Magasanikbacteria bacterium CG_4_9_14_0_2_um_filter_42_11 TaxID=1974643 RepID=A0A2M8F9E5_9BACT|nr:MAG: type II toxin-antitoxin system mRNA interferase toxin, RelE/StbE family [Candidatus Magasanikbacteria bacterium CG_4_10_14_0_8_um_filter_42_12]PJC52364.1 MAG: type II toxin-antitoxin system mRNA interferase toxin, RelE/StbE family [Candidatus Magasanikbacteria bacterium CG_4_9_14_0_2_um_filter_42_11]
MEGTNAYSVIYTKKFKKQYKKIHGKNTRLETELLHVIAMLQTDTPLLAKHENHRLKGKVKHLSECHILPDWLLIYEKDTDARILVLVEMGTHTNLFG